MAPLVRPNYPSLLCCFLFLWLLPIAGSFRCQSCFAGCRTFDDCDCEGDSNSTCDGPYCYAKLEYFNDDGVSAIQKGCINDVSTSYVGCQYASDDRSIACFCSGDFCNSALNLTSYETPDLPTITCCECNNDETGNEICFPQNCTRNCTGNYCYLDMVANAQGCGWGHPQIFHFLRTQKYRRWENELTCAEYYDNYRNYMSGCTCSSDMCNMITDVEQLNTRRRAQTEQRKTHFCHTLYTRSDTSFGPEIYRHASLCPSYFCFISWTSAEVIIESDDDDGVEMGSGESEYYTSSKRHLSDFGIISKTSSSLPTLNSMYEISAGCLLVDDESKVQLGCTTEWSQDERSPLTKHCICAERLCNGFHLIDDRHLITETSTATSAPSISNEADPEDSDSDSDGRLPFRPGSFSSLGPLDSSEIDVESSTERVNLTLVPVTSAFETSAMTEPDIVASPSSPVPTSTEPVQETTPAPSGDPDVEEDPYVGPTRPAPEDPDRPPEGHYRAGDTSGANSSKMVVNVCTLILILCTAVFK